MLSYQPPFMDIGSLTIFQDDEDKETFYYTNVQPSIVQLPEGPSISAYTILPENSIGENVNDVMDTSLSLEVSLKVSDALLDKARKEIKEKWGRNVRRLVPATVTDGKVYIIIAAAGETPDPKDWYVSSGNSPSIFGDNRAALVIKTSGEDAKRLIAALNSDMVAGHVYYELNMLGVTPTFRAKMRIKWDRIYKHFEEMKVKNFIFYRDEISNTLDDLKESSLVELEIEELDPDIRDYASKALLNELKTEAIKRLFKPAVPPLSSSEKIENRIAQGLGMIHSSLIPGSHYILRNNKEIETTEFVVDLSERKVKKYPYYPQALLSSMIRDIGGLQDHLKWIRLDHLPFRKETITIDIASDVTLISNIKSIKVSCEVYNRTTNEIEQTHTFVYSEKETLQSKFNFNKKKEDDYIYRYKTTVYLNNAGTGLPPTLEVDWIETTAEYIYFNPADYFQHTHLTIDVDDKSIFDHSHLIEVTVTATRKDNEEAILSETFLFKKDKGEKGHELSIMHSKLYPVSINIDVTYFIEGEHDYKVSYLDNKDYSFFIANPFKNKWSVDLITKADWEKTFKIITEIRVFELSRKQYLTEKITFTKENASNEFNAVTSLETPKSQLEYRSTVIDINGNMIRSAWLEHQGTILLIKDEVKAQRALFFELIAAPDIHQFDIKEILLSVVYKDEDNAIDINSDTKEKLVFSSVGEVIKFVHPMPNSAQLNYSYRITVRSNSSRHRYKSNWITTNEEHVMISIPDNIW